MARLSITITGLEFGALIISLFFTGWAALAAAKAATIADEATENAETALEIAAKNASAAERQVLLSEDAAQKQLRAYLVVSSVDARDFGPGYYPSFKIELTNTGQTPAISVQMETAFCLLAKGALPSRQIPEVSERRSLTVGANKPVQANPGLNRELTEGEWNGLKSGDILAFVMIYARYNDVFGHPHEVGLHGVVSGLPEKAGVEPVLGTDIFS